MIVGENIRGGLSEIWGHKLRSALTLIGIVLGTFSINAMFSIVAGVRASIAGVFATVGLDTAVFVAPQEVPRDERTAWALASKGLTVEDSNALRDQLPAALVSPVSSFMREIEHDGKRSQVTFQAVSEDYLAIRNLTVEKGRGITWGDQIGQTPVAVIGHKVSTDLFGAEDPVGKEIPVGSLRFKVVGLLKQAKLPPGFQGGGLDFEGNTVYVPITTAKAYVLGPKPGIFLSMKATDGDFMRLAQDSRTVLARRHRNSPDFEVENVGESILKEKSEVDHMLGNFNIVLGCIAGAALIVGGIGILSLMLIAVNERLFEIGTRKAVGATDGEILLQFLVESATLSTLGAIIGTILAVIATKLLGHNFPTGLAISASGLLLAGFFAIGIGVGFGLYPAWLASRLDPVEALRAA